MIDIHCHLLYGVDDGAKTPEISTEMLMDAASQGVTDLIVTPHYRQGMFPYVVDDIRSSFFSLRKKAADLRVRLYLGCEYRVDDAMVANMQSGRCYTLAESDCVLAEYSHSSTVLQIRNSLESLITAGYTPVIAHAERYDAFAQDLSFLKEVKDMGAMIQINADSILGRDGAQVKKLCRQILKASLADIVASDAHDMDGRRSHLRKCRDFVVKEYGWDSAMKLFTVNPLKILERNGE